jgi:hypothetical protein
VQKNGKNAAFPGKCAGTRRAFPWREEEEQVEEGARMQQLTLVFEIVLLVAIVIGAFACWDGPAEKERKRLRNGDQSPT